VFCVFFFLSGAGQAGRIQVDIRMVKIVILSTSGRVITILDHHALESLAEGE
jgi:hypothetical protein